MLPVVTSIGLFGPMIVAAIFLIWRRRRGGDQVPEPRLSPSDKDMLIRELSTNDYRP